MTEVEYVAWLAEAIPVYAANKVASGEYSKEDSLELSKKDFDELLPQGLQTPDHYLFTIVNSQAAGVGILWFAVKTKFDAPSAYVYNVTVWPERRREGHAYRAFLALEDETRKMGLSGIALHVFAHNTAAQALYAKLGYRPTNIHLFKPLAPAGA